MKNEILQGDALTILKTLQNETIADKRLAQQMML